MFDILFIVVFIFVVVVVVIVVVVVDEVVGFHDVAAGGALDGVHEVVLVAVDVFVLE